MFTDIVKKIPARDYKIDGLEVHVDHTPIGTIYFDSAEKEVVFPEHAHAEQWTIVVSGSCTFTANGESKTYSAGDVYIIPAGLKHQITLHAGYSEFAYVDDPRDGEPGEKKFDAEGNCMADFNTAVEKAKEMAAAPSCYSVLKEKTQAWLSAIGTDGEYAAAVAFLAETKADILPIDRLIEAAEKMGNAELLAHAKEVKANGGKYCDCPACTLAAEIIALEEIILNNSAIGKIACGLQTIVTALSQQADGHLIHSKIFAAQGLSKLAKQYADHAAEERGYVEKCIERIIDLGGDVKLEDKKCAPVCSDAEEYLKYDLQVSRDGLKWLAEIVKLAQCDLTSFDLLKDYYKDEEGDMYWTEQQLGLIKLIGRENWLAKQI